MQNSCRGFRQDTSAKLMFLNKHTKKRRAGKDGPDDEEDSNEGTEDKEPGVW